MSDETQPPMTADEVRRFWTAAERTAEEVRSWPAWLTGRPAAEDEAKLRSALQLHRLELEQQMADLARIAAAMRAHPRG